MNHPLPTRCTSTAKRSTELITWQVLEDGIGVDDVERLIGERQGASVEYDGLHAGEAVLIVLHIGEGNTSSDNPRAVFVKRFKLLRQSNAGPGGPYIEDARFGSGAQQLHEEPVLLLPRFAM